MIWFSKNKKIFPLACLITCFGIFVVNFGLALSFLLQDFWYDGKHCACNLQGKLWLDKTCCFITNDAVLARGQSVNVYRSSIFDISHIVRGLTTEFYNFFSFHNRNIFKKILFALKIFNLFHAQKNWDNLKVLENAINNLKIQQKLENSISRLKTSKMI